MSLHVALSLLAVSAKYTSLTVSHTRGTAETPSVGVETYGSAFSVCCMLPARSHDMT